MKYIGYSKGNWFNVIRGTREM